MTDKTWNAIQTRWSTLRQSIGTDSIDALLDAFLLIYDESFQSLSTNDKAIWDFQDYARPLVAQVKQSRVNRNDFDLVKIIRRGAFGEVSVVKLKSTEQTFALKTVKKSDILSRVDTASFREERDVLLRSDSPWITKLHFTFQDHEHLYFLMDYYYGGDLLSLLSKYDEQFSEDMAKFYLAEMIVAIDSLHQLGYVHRDIKPDNVLIDAQGHVRLADFGSSLRLRADRTVQCNIAVGTPDYVSPEVLNSMNNGQEIYGVECDWWALGCVMWEMLFGGTPFYAQEIFETYRKILAHVQSPHPLAFPDDVNISPSARDLLQRLLCSRERRLGCGGLADFQRHPFFVKIEWNSLRKTQAPFIPSRNPSMIEDPPLVDPIPAPIDRSRSRAPILRHTAFIGFTSSNSQNDEPEKVRRSSDDDPMQKYLLTVVQFFDSLRGTKSSLPRTSSFETLKTHLDKQMQTCRSLDSPSSTFTRRSLADQVDQLIQQFSSENPPSPVDKFTEPVLLRLQAFLERTSQQLKTTSREKLDLEEKRDRKVSSISNKEVNPLWRNVRLIKAQHMELHQLKAIIANERQAKQELDDELKRTQEVLNSTEQENLRLRERIEVLEKQQTISKKPSFTNEKILSRFLPRAINSEDLPPSPSEHQFLIETFHSPLVCHQCENALLGLVRQGFICRRCEMVCHRSCQNHVRTPCLLSNVERNRLHSLDQFVVRLPKPGGMGKGWDRYYLFNLGTKLLFYSINLGKGKKSGSANEPAIVLDMTNEEFEVSSVRSTDIYHAEKRDVTSIFKISIGTVSVPKKWKNVYILANDESHKEFYLHLFSALSDRIPSEVLRTGDFIAKKIFESSQKGILAAVLIDRTRFLVSADDGLYLLDLGAFSLRRLIGGVIHQFTVLIERDLLLLLGGKSRKIWLKSLRSCLEAVPSPLNREIDDLRSVHFFSFDPVKLVLAVVMKTSIRLYQFFSSTRQMHYECLTDLHLAQPIAYLDFFTLNNGDEHYLCYGSSSTFFSQRLDQQRAASVVVLRDGELLQRERAAPPLILRLIALTASNELLLIYNEFGVYVDAVSGRRSRPEEFLWPTSPRWSSYVDPHLFLFMEKSIEIYDVHSSVWLQSMSIGKTRPLTSDGLISLSFDPNVTHQASTGQFLYLTRSSRETLALDISPCDVSISPPIDFKHQEGMNRDEGLRYLASLPAPPETSDEQSSMYQ